MSQQSMHATGMRPSLCFLTQCCLSCDTLILAGAQYIVRKSYGMHLAMQVACLTDERIEEGRFIGQLALLRGTLAAGLSQSYLQLGSAAEQQRERTEVAQVTQVLSSAQPKTSQPQPSQNVFTSSSLEPEPEPDPQLTSIMDGPKVSSANQANKAMQSLQQRWQEGLRMAPLKISNLRKGIQNKGHSLIVMKIRYNCKA